MPKTLALVAHDQRKADLLDWARGHREALSGHHLVATGTTGTMIAEALSLDVECMLSGPAGGDMQLGAAIAEGRIDLLIFFWDPLTAQPHDPDVKALLRLAVMWDLPTACNRATADFLVRSPHFHGAYERQPPALEGPSERLRRLLEGA